MLDPTGELWITDFGLARIVADPTLSVTGDVMGTLRYMVPNRRSANAASSIIAATSIRWA